MIKGHLKTILLAAIVIVYTGCAAKQQGEIIWPSPPNQPRIRFDNAISGSKSFYGTSVVDLLLGEEDASAFVKPIGVHVDIEGRVYVSDTATGSVTVFDSLAKSKSAEMLLVNGNSPFSKPVGISTDSMGNIYVADTTVDRVFVFDSSRNLLRILGDTGEFKQPSGLAVDPARNKLYIVDTHNHNIVVVDINSWETVKKIGKRGREEGEFNFPANITVDSKGNIYIVDTMNGRIQIFDQEGRFIRAFGKLGDGPGMFSRPKGIAVDSEGHIYVVDSGFNNVQIFDQEGQILMAFSGYGEGRGQQILPAGVAIDKEDKIYVVDQWNARINVFEYMGDKYTERKGIKAREDTKKK